MPGYEAWLSSLSLETRNMLYVGRVAVLMSCCWAKDYYMPPNEDLEPATAHDPDPAAKAGSRLPHLLSGPEHPAKSNEKNADTDSQWTDDDIVASRA